MTGANSLTLNAAKTKDAGLQAETQVGIVGIPRNPHLRGSLCFPRVLRKTSVDMKQAVVSNKMAAEHTLTLC